MKPNPIHRLPAPLEAAVQRLKLASREAAERTIESLGLAALASGNAFHRDGLLGAQFELNRKSAVFALAFNDALDERLMRALGPRVAAADTAPAAAWSALQPAPATSAPTDWAALSLVEDKEVDAQISVDRFGMDIAHVCEWELRELDSYVGSLLADIAVRSDAHGGPDNTNPDTGRNRDRNPLRPELVGHAMVRGIEATSEQPDVRRVLTAELSRSLAALLPAAYAAIVAGMRDAGVQPMGLAVRNRSARTSGRGEFHSDRAVDSGSGSGNATLRGAGAGTGVDRHRPNLGHGHDGSQGNHRSSTLGQVSPDLMHLIRRLAHNAGDAGSGHGADGTWGLTAQDSAAGGRGHADGHANGHASGHASGYGAAHASGHASGYGGGHASGYGSGYGGGHARLTPPPNLIRTHRDALRQASKGAIDHMVIDVIGFLFDQILADPKVPPQMARQIARLQLPVLRAALGDPAFFSSRKHPVRRFVNRIASLGAAFEDFGDDDAKALLAKVKTLVQEVVEGDFEQIAVYEQKLAALEGFTTELAARSLQQGPDADAAALLSEKEDQQRLRQLYAQRLAGELKDVDAPPFLREFLSAVWSQVLLRAAEQGGAEGAAGAQVKLLRDTGRALYLSVQPKATPAHRKVFLAELPRLMTELSEGMNLIQWPEAQRRNFFGKLMPAHAEALKSASARTLDINLMARKVEGALQRPLPSRDDLRHADLPVLTDEVSAQVLAPVFSADEARRAGLVQESAVDWNGSVDIDLGSPGGAALAAEAEEAARDAAEEAAQQAATSAAGRTAALPGLPVLTDVAEPTQGLELAQHVQVGFAYRMHLDGDWHKVRLSHVSSARSFFLFTHGGRHRRTVSLTKRMLERLCATGRLKAYESAYLMERATARVRRQLSAVS